jgi:hypothetical protein
MKDKKTKIIIGYVCTLGLLVVSCSDQVSQNAGTAPNNPNPSSTAVASVNIGNFDVSCGQQSSIGQQSQKVPFQQHEQEGCNSKHNIKFSHSQVSDFDVNLECDLDRVVVKNKGVDSKESTFPIQSDGSVNGQMQYLQQIDDDGRGHPYCWVEYVVSFNGKAHCNHSFDMNTAPPSYSRADTSISPSPTPSTAANYLELNTLVSLQNTTPEALVMAGIADSSTATPNLPSSFETLPSAFSPTPSVTPSITPKPTHSPTPFFTPTPISPPSINPTPHPTGSHTPLPTPTLVPVTICVVDNPCPESCSTNISCPQSPIQY